MFQANKEKPTVTKDGLWAEFPCKQLSVSRVGLTGWEGKQKRGPGPERGRSPTRGGERAEVFRGAGYRESWAGRGLAAVSSPTLPGGAVGSGLSKF